LTAAELITQAVLPLRTSDSGEFALQRMDELKVNHLPIVNRLELLGLLSESDVLGLNNPSASVGDHRLSLGQLFVDEGQHLYEVLRVFSQFKLSLLPVLNAHKHYLGVITREDLVTSMSTLTAVDQPGAVLVLEVNTIDYSLSEIVQIVESNGGNILSVYSRSNGDSTKMEVTLKLGKMEISSVLQAFNRYNYTVKASFSESTYYDDLLDNYKALMHYLSI
jgi:acetoin utilization protein AcuB